MHAALVAAQLNLYAHFDRNPGAHHLPNCEPTSTSAERRSRLTRILIVEVAQRAECIFEYMLDLVNPVRAFRRLVKPGRARLGIPAV